MQGFAVAGQDVPAPPVRIEDDTRQQLMRVLMAVVSGETPEEVAGYVADGEFPAHVVEALERPLEAEEMSAHVDLLLGVIQSAPATAGV